MDEKILEQAGDYADSMINEGIANARQKAKRPIGFDGHCDCGAVIPEGRIAHELYNCVHCQEAIERRKKLYRPW